MTNDREIGSKQEKEKVVQYHSFVVLAKEPPKVVVVRIKVIEDWSKTQGHRQKKTSYPKSALVLMIKLRDLPLKCKN